MAVEKITVSWDDVNSPQVDERLKEQRVEPEPAPPLPTNGRKSAFFYDALFYMSLFGLIGGLLGWIGGEIMHLRPDPRVEFVQLSADYDQIMNAWRDGTLTPGQAEAALKYQREGGKENPYFAIHVNDSLSPEEKLAQRTQLQKQDAWKDFLANILFYGAAGMAIAACIAIADPLVERNFPRAIINGSIGAMLGLAGGVAVSFFIDKLYANVLASGGSAGGFRWEMIANTVKWGLLGLFLSLSPGIVLLNLKKLFIGAAGGLLGGIVGGLLYQPIVQWTESEHVARLIALIAIGVVTGFATGLIENAAKQGWLKVVSGLIAGKQFILYRNPTFIGNSLQCHIYLFKDPQVGRRHAAVHVVPGGFELEDLPLGGRTLVNGRAVNRTRLRSGDQITIGQTTFMFQEKNQAA